MATEERRNSLREQGAENRVKGKLDEFGGKVRGAWGDAVDDESQELKGKAQELKGKLRQGMGKVQQKLSEAGESDDEPGDPTP